jgi:uncharacterized protein (DUF1800 family)
LWKEYYRDVPEGDEKYTRIYQPVRETQFATLLRAIHSRRQLYEVLVNFWHDHFNVAPERDERIAPGFANYAQGVIRKHALGNFRQFLEAVATHPAMLYYLDNASSRSGPNENWPRELFELHTLGAENYLGCGPCSRPGKAPPPKASPSPRAGVKRPRGTEGKLRARREPSF